MSRSRKLTVLEHKTLGRQLKLARGLVIANSAALRNVRSKSHKAAKLLARAYSLIDVARYTMENEFVLDYPDERWEGVYSGANSLWCDNFLQATAGTPNPDGVR